MKSSAKPDAAFAADGGLDHEPRNESDPYLALDELMTAVEALCPSWPPRSEPTVAHRMLM